jgi:hypothetical protein
MSLDRARRLHSLIYAPNASVDHGVRPHLCSPNLRATLTVLGKIRVARRRWQRAGWRVIDTQVHDWGESFSILRNQSDASIMHTSEISPDPPSKLTTS